MSTRVTADITIITATDDEVDHYGKVTKPGGVAKDASVVLKFDSVEGAIEKITQFLEIYK